MKKSVLTIILSLITVFTYAQDKSEISKLSFSGIDSLLRETSKQNLSVSEKMNHYSKMFLGMKYDLECVGDGEYSIYEPWPLVNFQGTNCMAYCEHVLAMSISDNWDNFFNNLQQIRYKDGVISIKNRNHYTMADWLPENNWLLENISAKVGNAYVSNINRTISHKKFFASKGMKHLDYVKEDRKMKVDYIPLAEFGNVIGNLKTGDILVLLHKKLDNIFAAHMLMVMENNGKKIIREATTSTMLVIDTDINKWVSYKQKNKSDKYIGLSVIRLKENINKVGKIILPWEIASIK
ncbi:MAG: N-acetylmuramoyl-L-alanine amidase-like domain-containing protein [Bacteroidota bacterium]